MDKMSSKPEVDNSLRKRGSCPPIGEPIELWFGGSFAYKCEFICIRGNDYIVWNLDADRPDCADFMCSEFRPLRTEREKAIDEMASILVGCEKYAITQNLAMAASELLYDAGCRMLKP